MVTARPQVFHRGEAGLLSNIRRFVESHNNERRRSPPISAASKPEQDWHDCSIHLRRRKQLFHVPLIASGKSRAPMLSSKIKNRPDGYNPNRINLLMRHVVVTLDVIEVHRFGDAIMLVKVH